MSKWVKIICWLLLLAAAYYYGKADGLAIGGEYVEQVGQHCLDVLEKIKESL